MITYPLVLQTIASLTGIATSTSMIIAYHQLKLATRNSQLTFEDALAREYRQVGSRVPLRAVLGEDLADEALDAALPDFYWYFDLSNQQAYLRRNGRVSDLTWATWAEGIRTNMQRPAFARAWAKIAASQPALFADLRWFLTEEERARRTGPDVSRLSSQARARRRKAAGRKRAAISELTKRLLVHARRRSTITADWRSA